MSKTFEFPKRDDNSSEDAEKLVKWATQFDGVDAHIVFDYITDSLGNSMRGALNGVTLQWDHDGAHRSPLSVAMATSRFRPAIAPVGFSAFGQ